MQYINAVVNYELINSHENYSTIKKIKKYMYESVRDIQYTDIQYTVYIYKQTYWELSSEQLQDGILVKKNWILHRLSLSS